MIPITNNDIELWLKEKWKDLYQKCLNGEIHTREYTKRRRSYENMLMELELLNKK